LFCGLAATLSHADPYEEIASFSALAKVDRAKVEKGEIFSARVPGVTLPRGQVIESVFLVEAPVGKTVASLREWNGSRHSELKVYLHVDLPGAGSPADYVRLAAAPPGGPLREFAGAGEKDLQLSAAEVAQLPPQNGRETLSPAQVSFWSGLLNARVHAFATGGLPTEPPYGTGPAKIAAAADLTSLLTGEPKYSARFRPLLDALGIGGKPAGKPEFYWEMTDVHDTAAVTLGAGVSGNRQLADVQFYASGGAYVALTLHQLWPVQGPGGPATLVWRGDLLSAGALGELHGIERSVAASVVSREIVRSIGFFQKDAGQP
jgi:hypothetical protein